MLKFTFLSAFILLFTSAIIAQDSKEFAPSGQIEGKIYTNYHYALEGSQGNGFALERAYFGYGYKLSEVLSAKVKLDVDGSDANGYRTAYFKTAAMFYKAGDIKIGFGLQDCYQFKVQEKFWGKRYLYKSFQDANKYGNSADLGITAVYKKGNLAADFGIYNGEGYKKVQKDSTYRIGLGLTYTINKSIILRGYQDVVNYEDNTQTVSSFFTGYNAKKFNLGVEVNQMNNAGGKKDNNYTGYSFYGKVFVCEKASVFARYDNNTPKEGDDNTAIIGGIEYSLSSKVNAALNYQDIDSGDKNAIFFNLEFAF